MAPEYGFFRFCSHYGINSHRKQNESSEYDIELVVTREYFPKPLQTQEESFNFIPAFIDYFIIYPRLFSVLFWRNDRNISKFYCQRTRLVAFVSTVHNQITMRLIGGSEIQ